MHVQMEKPITRILWMSINSMSNSRDKSGTTWKKNQKKKRKNQKNKMKNQRKKRTIVNNQRINCGRNIMENQTAYLKSLMEANQKWQSLESYAATNQVPFIVVVSMDYDCQLLIIK